jgi:hypothetical protein
MSITWTRIFAAPTSFLKWTGAFTKAKLDGAKVWLANDLGSDWSTGKNSWLVVNFDPTVSKETTGRVGRHSRPALSDSLAEKGGGDRSFTTTPPLVSACSSAVGLLRRAILRRILVARFVPSTARHLLDLRDESQDRKEKMGAREE